MASMRGIIINTNIMKIFFLTFILSALFVTGENCISAPVIENEAIIEGVVAEYSIISSHLIGIEPEQVLYRLVIHVQSSKNVMDKANFLISRRGEDIQFYSRDKLAPELFGKRISAYARFSGDERGGKFWIRNIEVIE
jgi:hypothetical protein